MPQMASKTMDATHRDRTHPGRLSRSLEGGMVEKGKKTLFGGNPGREGVRGGGLLLVAFL